MQFLRMKDFAEIGEAAAAVYRRECVGFLMSVVYFGGSDARPLRADSTHRVSPSSAVLCPPVQLWILVYSKNSGQPRPPTASETRAWSTAPKHTPSQKKYPATSVPAHFHREPSSLPLSIPPSVPGPSAHWLYSSALKRATYRAVYSLLPSIKIFSSKKRELSQPVSFIFWMMAEFCDVSHCMTPNKLQPWNTIEHYWS